MRLREYQIQTQISNFEDELNLYHGYPKYSNMNIPIELWELVRDEYSADKYHISFRDESVRATAKKFIRVQGESNDWYIEMREYNKQFYCIEVIQSKSFKTRMSLINSYSSGNI